MLQKRKYNFFKENRCIHILSENKKPWTAPGGAENNLFMGPSPLHKQTEVASRTPPNLISGICNGTRKFISDTIGIPFRALRSAGEYIADTTQKVAHVGDRAIQGVTAGATAIATLPAVAVSKLSTIAGQVPGTIVKTVLRPIRAILSRLPFTGGDAEKSSN